MSGYMEILAIVGLFTSAVSLIIIGYAASAAVLALDLKMASIREMRSGLRQAAAAGWNTSEMPEFVYLIAKCEQWVDVGRRTGDRFLAEGWSAPLDCIEGWIHYPPELWTKRQVEVMEKERQRAQESEGAKS